MIIDYLRYLVNTINIVITSEFCADLVEKSYKCRVKVIRNLCKSCTEAL